VSLHRVHARFLLPRSATSAFVAGDNGWVDGLRAAGVQVAREPAGEADLAVASSRDLAAALRAGSEMVILEGRSGERKLRREGYATWRVLPLPRLETPVLLLPLDQPAASSYAVEYWTVPGTLAKRARKRVVQTLVRRGFLPPLKPLIIIGLRHGRSLPFVLERARGLGIPADVEWFLVSRPEYELGRGLFVVFPIGSSTPAWVVKFARVPGYAEPFDRDEHGLSLVKEAPPSIAGRAPRLLGRVDADGLHASVESAAEGRRMDSFLSSRVARSTKLGLIETVADWVSELNRSTRVAADHGAAERTRLADEVVSLWVERGVSANLVDTVADVPLVLQHNDLGCWNIVADRGSFTVVDWESARRHGLPLWDLWYFLADALAGLDNAWDPIARERHFVRLFRGELPASRTLFTWTRRIVDTLQIPTTAVGPLATLCWLHHARSHADDMQRLQRHARHAVAPEWLTVRLPEIWLGQPGLGSSWNAWNA
jgi:hypothetical protein